MTFREVSSTLPTATDNAYSFDLVLFDEVVFEVVLELELTEVDDWVAGAAMVGSTADTTLLPLLCCSTDEEEVIGRALAGEPPLLLFI